MYFVRSNICFSLHFFGELFCVLNAGKGESTPLKMRKQFAKYCLQQLDGFGGGQTKYTKCLETKVL